MDKINLGTIVAYKQKRGQDEGVIRIKLRNSIKLDNNTCKGVYLMEEGNKAALIDENDEYKIPSQFAVLLNQSCIFEFDLNKKEVVSLEYVTNQTE